MHTSPRRFETRSDMRSNIADAGVTPSPIPARWRCIVDEMENAVALDFAGQAVIVGDAGGAFGGGEIIVVSLSKHSSPSS